MKYILISISVVLVWIYTANATTDETYLEIKALLDQIEHNSTLASEFDKHFKVWNALDSGIKLPRFDCNSANGARSKQRPTSVHQLRPGDIDVVAAIGDSITASCGSKARTAAGLLLEYRGISWSIGGDGSVDTGVYTIPNMLKKYNPKVKGYSTGVIPVITQQIFPKKVGFNVAISGAKSKGILGQAETLVEKMKKDKSIDFENDWKMVTLFIGGNDLCAFCKDEKAYSVEEYQNNIDKTLEYLRENLPNTLVNVVPMLDLTQLSQVNSGFVCGILHRLVCKCGSYPADQIAKVRLIEEVVEYSNSILSLMADKSYDKDNNFTVVAQPFLINQRLPTIQNGEPDLSFFAPDCFHFSAKGHAVSAQGLWNNMFEPAGKKRLSWFNDEAWKCPSEKAPYIYTYRNSGYFSSDSPLGRDSSLGSTAGVSSKRESDDLENKIQTGAENSEIKSSDNDKSATTAASIAAPLVGGICIGAVMVVIALIVIKAVNRPKRRPALADESNSRHGYTSL